jgi:phosphoglycolate phosphatase
VGKRFDLVVFDWDGTLMDSTAIIVASLQATCADVGLPVPSDERSHHIIGLGLYDAMAHVLPGVSTTVYPQVVERYGHHFRTREPHSPLFASAETAARHAWRGHRLAIATGRGDAGSTAHSKKPGWRRCFAPPAAAKSRRPSRRPDTARFDGHAGTIPERTVMIGDTTHDLQMAANAGVARSRRRMALIRATNWWH